MRDILSDDEHKLKPLSLVMLTTSAILSTMILYNTIFAQPRAEPSVLSAAQPAGAKAGAAVNMPVAAGSTVVFQYDVTVEEVQRALLAIGLFKGLVDGVNGQRTKNAIQLYQQQAGLPVTGEITPALLAKLRYTQRVKAASEYTGSITPAPAVAVTTEPSPLAQAALRASEEPVSAKIAPRVAAAAPPVGPTPKKLTQNTRVMSAQKLLVAKGYSISAVNGQMNAETRAAILQFEMDNGLEMQGIVDVSLLQALASR
ncbi:MAG: peptidoglycan-binding protein [Alphaproteobacteria bacterium]|nr:peptidoglycan-binding protein [Alphaproteobacteria bacterium]